MALTFRERRAARVLVLTPDERVLLMNMQFPWLDQPIWIAPGGGLKADETWEAAAIRELREETGLVAQFVGPAVWERTIDIHHEARITRLHERYFLIKAAHFDPSASGHEDRERGWFLGFRWWRLSEIGHSDFVEEGPTLQRIIAAGAEPTRVR